MATLIKTDGTLKEVKPANGKEFTLKEMQALVGGYIERVEPYIPMKKGLTVLVNEDGQNLKLPFNLAATKMTARQLVGDVLICERGEFT